MNTENAKAISVIAPISPAIGRVKLLLFKPFDLAKWFVIGFCAWLAYLGKAGGGGGGGRPSDAREAFGQAKEFVLENLAWIIPVAAIVVALIIVLWLVITWLSSRGRFMFLHCVARNKAEVKIPWEKFRQHANSLFLFRLVLGVIMLLTIVLFSVITVLLVIASKTNGIYNATSLAGLVVDAFIFVLIFLAFLLVHKFTTDFVVPIMYLRTASCTAAWREFLGILSAEKVAFTLYILFQIVIAMVIVGILLAAACITCCCAACIFSIPYIGTVLMLPLYVFKRSYSLYYFRQYGPQFDVFHSSRCAAAAGEPTS